jgi:uncharacterized membrane protein YGL010W
VAAGTNLYPAVLLPDSRQGPVVPVTPIELAIAEAYGSRMRTADQWLDEYGSSHLNPTNEALHWVCVPVILWCVLGLLWVTPFPGGVRAAIPLANWATLITLFAVIYYALLSVPLALGILPLLILMLWSLDALSRNTLAPLRLICVTLFVLAWIGQFIGHAIEKKRPSFFKDLQFLMIGPMWLMANVYRRLGVRF